MASVKLAIKVAHTDRDLLLLPNALKTMRRAARE
jgi:hypothetical protein